jgi:hypothetical protein
MIGHPSTCSFIAIIGNNLLSNCPVTCCNVAMVKDIFGPDVGYLNGKTMRSASTPANVSLVDIPATIMTHYFKLILGENIIFVNKIHFFMTIFCHIKFGAVKMLKNQLSTTILATIKKETGQEHLHKT